jgi:hypothetical protein
MSNHTIKAISKSNGEIIEFRVENDYWLGDEYYSQESFNDLFEIVEDNMSNTCKEHVMTLHDDKQAIENIPQTDTLKKEEVSATQIIETLNKIFTDAEYKVKIDNVDINFKDNA